MAETMMQVLILSLLTVMVIGVLGLNYNIYTFAGTGQSGSSGTGKATSAIINQPRAIWADTQLNIYIVETGSNCIRRIDSSSYILSNFAGICGAAGSSAGDNGQATAAGMNFAVGLFIDSTSRAYFAEYGGNRVRLVATNGIVTAFAGTGTAGSDGNGGKASSATLSGAHGVWANTQGIVYLLEFTSHYARVVSTANIITLLAGTFNQHVKVLFIFVM